MGKPPGFEKNLEVWVNSMQHLDFVTHAAVLVTPRTGSAPLGGSVLYHVINRRNAHALVFHAKHGDLLFLDHGAKARLAR
jgi:hypothetical protein